MPSLGELQICEIPPPGVIGPSRKVGIFMAFQREEEDANANWWPYPTLDPTFLVSRRLHWLVARQWHLRAWGPSLEEEIRAYTVPLVEAFHDAARAYPQIGIDPDVMAGAPCIQGTRIPVYMILDAIEYHGSLEGAINSYPYLTLDQVKEAIGFAKLVVECPIEYENTVTAR